MKKILVPVDFSRVSAQAARFAVELAEKNNSEITFLNSVHFDFFGDYQFASLTGINTLMKEVSDAMEIKMEEFVDQFKTRKRIHTVVSMVDLVTAIEKMVEDEGYDLLVVGTKGTSGLQEVFIGSITEKIVRSAPCPVISVPVKYSVDQINRILIPIDIQEIKPGFMEKIAELQHQFAAKFEFLWVKTPHNIEQETKVRAELRAYIQSFGVFDFEITIIRNVFPSDGILAYADQSDADMIAMATHARRGIAHWLIGSLTEDTVNHIKIPVWSCKLNKKEKAVTLESVANAQGKADYKKLEVLTEG